MSIWKEIDGHMNNVFDNYANAKTLKNLPTKEQLKNLDNNTLYKVNFASIAIDVVDFKLLNQYSEKNALNAVMNEFFYGVTKIFKSISTPPSRIDIQGDGVYSIYRIETKADIDLMFTLLCCLNSFQKHIIKKIKSHFPLMIKKDSYSESDFTFGIGASFSFENYISLVGHGKDKDLIFMGHAVNYSNELAKKAHRNNNEPIMFDNLFYENFSDKQKEKANKIGGISKSYNKYTYQENIYECNWIITPYDNFIDNNTK